MIKRRKRTESYQIHIDFKDKDKKMIYKIENKRKMDEKMGKYQGH